MKDKVLFYHKDCPDGWGCCWTFKKKFGDEIDCIPLSFTDPIPDGLEGKEVWIADFSFKRDVILMMKEVTKSLVVIDHHKTAEANLSGLDFCHFDMTHSGAVLSWMYCFPDSEIPPLLLYIEDRDLWNWKLENSKQILSVIDSYSRSHDDWDVLNSYLKSEETRIKLIEAGTAILRYRDQEIKNIASNFHFIDILGDKIPAVNSRIFQSELCRVLADSNNSDYAAVYFFDGKNFIFSLRSGTKKDFDVSGIAVRFGGGGHKAASGFNVRTLQELNAQGSDLR